MGGSSKGGSSHTPVEAKETGRSFQIARILEVLSEGEIYGLVDDMSSVYLDKTPLQNKDGTFNFKNVSVYANAGTQDQDVLREFSAVEKEVNVNTKILKDKPIIKTVTDTNVTRIRMTLGVERLIRQEDNGDTNGTSVTMTVQVIKDTRIYSSTDYTFNGKYSNPYREMFDLNVPQAPFQIKVIRVEPDSDTNKLQNNCFWSSYTEIIDKAFAYPNTALVGIKIDSEYFNDIPQRNYEIYGLIVKVPSNYNAFNHTYTSDFWDGSFKLSWTNNPAWIFYDLVTNTRYGMGQRLQDFGIDKWQLYAIGRYCDELVPDGFGGREPRMTCNIWITDQRKAYDLINDICSIFRAMPVWNGQALTAIQDRASDPVWTYNNANTIGGFTRQRSAKKARHNTIQVEYIDADDFYEKKVESVSDDVLVARYGQNVKKVTAFGCTSRGQAYRTGRWLLETEKLETETITFTVGQEGVMHLPYDVIEVADSQYAGLNVGGRILAVNGTQVTLDRTIEIDDQSYLSYVSKQAITENVKIVSFDKKTNIATLARDVSGTPELTVWGLTTKRIATGLYRAISIKENDNSEGKTYTITALQHVPEKEDIVINGTHFDPKPQTIYGDVVDADIKYNGTKLTVSGKVNGAYNVLSSKQITSYTVKLLKDGALVYIEKGLKSPDINVDNLENGNYEAQISAYNEKGQLLHQYTKTFVINRPPLVTGINVAGHFTSIVLTWDLIDDITETEIWVSETDDINTARLVERVTGCYYSHEVGAKQIRYYWLRHKRGVNVGSFDQLQGRKGESGVDIDAELEVLNKELGRNIIEEFIDTALPARKLGMMKYVNNPDLSQYQGQNLIYDEVANKQYMWNGTTYIPMEQEILASAIQGIIQPSQLAPIPTTNLAGKLTDAQIQSINATKVIGTLNISAVPSIPTNKLTGLLTNAQIQALDASKLTGNINIARVPNIPTTKLTGTIADTQIATLNASKLTGTVALDRLPSVPTTKLSGQITSDQLASVSSDKIDGTIDISKIPEIPTGMLSGQLSDSQIQSVNATKIAGIIGANQIASIPTTKLTGQLTDAQLTGISANKITGIIAVNQLASIPTTKLTGTITDAQIQSMNASKVSGVLNINAIPSVPTTKLTGTVSANQISANAIGANHIQAGIIGTSHLQADSIDASKMKANSIGANAIQAGAIGATHIQANSIGANNLQANSVGVNALQAGVVTAEKLATGSVDATKIKANSIGANHIGVNAVTSEKIQVGAINAQKIASDAIQSTHISANAIGANHITAGAITASKMVMYGENMVLDPLFEDKKYWRENIATNPNEPIEWGNGKIVITMTNKSISSGTYFYGLRQALNLPLDRGRSYRLQCRIKATGTLNVENLSTSAYIVTYPDTTARNTSTNWHNVASTAKWGVRDELVSCVINANAIDPTHNQIGVYLRVGCRTTGDIITGTVEFSELELIKMSDADLIVDGAITAQKVSANAITADKIQAGSVTVDKVATNAISADKIQSNAITSAKIVASAIDASKIATNAVTADKILANAVTAVKIASNSIVADKIATNAVTTDKINANAITAQKIASNAIEADKIKAGAVVAGKLATNAVVADNIATNAITAVKISAGAITAEKMSVNSVGANAIQANAVTADKLSANAVTAGKIQAGAINANHLQAGQISADKLAIGLGGNLLYNPIFANNGYGWGSSNGNYTGGTIDRTYASQSNADWGLKNPFSSEERMIKMTFVETITTAKNQWADVCRQKIRLIPNQWYMFSVYANSYRCSAMLLVEELNADGGYVKAVTSTRLHNRGSFVNGIDQNSRNFVKFQCPASGYVQVMVRANAQTASNPEVYVARPMLEECTQYTTQPSAWVNSGVTAIHGGSIVTNTITAQQIMAGTITANEIASRAINTVHLATNSVTADQIASGAVTAKHLTANSISGNHIQANSTLKSPNIEAGVIKGARIEGAIIVGAKIIGGTGDFTGDIIVKNQVGVKLSTQQITATATRNAITYVEHKSCKTVTGSPQQGGTREVCTYSYTGTQTWRKTGNKAFTPSEQVVIIPTNVDVAMLSIAPSASMTTGGRYVLNAGTNYTITFNKTGSNSATGGTKDDVARQLNAMNVPNETINIDVHRRFG